MDIEREDDWYNVATIDVISDNANAVACIGNSITDGRGTTTNLQNRWTDFFAEGVAENNVAVLNLGIGGNSVFYGGLSDPP